MKKTFVRVPEINCVDYNRSLCFIGSCFAENISTKAGMYGFNINSNPLGVVFNPISLGEFLLNIQNTLWNFSIVRQKDVYFSWEANSSVFGYSEQEISTQIQNKISSFENSLTKSSTLFVTFGTAWIYELKNNGHIVANCHKFDQSLFQKRLLTISEITILWNRVIEFLSSQYPTLNVVFTLSPVRHLKDGLIENARSKSILLESIHQLVDNSKNCYYFPAYEIVIDELRDYAFYSKDGIHPNEIAVDEVWSRFFDCMLSIDAQKIATEWMDLKRLLDHKIQRKGSEEARKFLKLRTKKLEAFKTKYPDFKIDL